jgi:phenylalanyl-tRNA synthetase beta chain
VNSTRASPKALDLPAGTVAAEIYLDAIPASRDRARAGGLFATAPAGRDRDFAFMVPADLAADSLVRAIRGADKAVITGAAVRPI